MKAAYSERFLASLDDAPPAVQEAFFKQLGLLMENLRHPSLRAKKFEGSRGLWQARVNRDWRFYFTIEGDEYRLHDIIVHRNKATPARRCARAGVTQRPAPVRRPSLLSWGRAAERWPSG